MITYFFDIETSRVKSQQGRELQVTYLCNLLEYDVLNNIEISSTFFRTLSQAIEHFKTLDKETIWCHNLDYELTFILRELESTNLVSGIFRDKNAPLSVNLSSIPNITFRDSYALFNTSVKALGDKLKFPKLEYDYKKVRLPWDKLEQHDYDYNKRDNEIVAISLSNLIHEKKYTTLEKIPLTFTSIVKTERYNFIAENFGTKAVNKFHFDRLKTISNYKIIDELMTVYQGGLTASVCKYTNKVIKNVFGLDIKSSYPNQLSTKKFPIFNEETTRIFKAKELASQVFKNNDYKHFVARLTFTNIRVKNDKYLLPISTAQITKGTSKGAKLFNGKLIKADKVSIPCTNIDYDVINLVYEYDRVECETIITTHKERYLRIEEVSFTLFNFLNKELGINKATSKLIINSLYGVKVSTIIKDEYTIEDSEVIQDTFFKKKYEDKEEIYYNKLDEIKKYSTKNLDVYSDGVWCTCYARQQLITMMVDLIERYDINVIYADTDSLKIQCDNVKELQEYINACNNNKIFSNKKLPRFKQFFKEFECEENEIELISTLGIWEIEDVDSTGAIAPHEYFKTLGAKKYCYVMNKNHVDYDNKTLGFKTTIAGCNKKNLPIVYSNVVKNGHSVLDVIELLFAPGITFDTTASGRTTAQKEKDNVEEYLNLTYDDILICQNGGILIDDTTYTLGIGINDSEIIGRDYEDSSVLKININGEIY